jgi:hypothetical protein
MNIAFRVIVCLSLKFGEIQMPYNKQLMWMERLLF